VLVPRRPLQPILIFVGKTRNLLMSVKHER
jgi:hypothetical protein